MSRSTNPEDLAARRSVKRGGREVIRTPLVVPSFSSKGFPEVRNILDTLEEKITDCVLVSAYDSHYGSIRRNIEFPELLFIDSGGYECSKDSELSDLGYVEHSPREWNRDLYLSELSKWDFKIPTVLISYDHPQERLPLDRQIVRAKSLFRGRNVLKELLVKPENKGRRYVQIKSVLKYIREFRHFDVLGFTEKELGNNLLDRMLNVATVRKALTKVGLRMPVHIFGSLDTISTPLYFVSGADIFDGLTWLRFAYHGGHSLYVHDVAAIQYGPQVPDWDVKPLVWSSNYYALQKLQRAMRNFLNERDWSLFDTHADFFSGAYESLVSELAGGK